MASGKIWHLHAQENGSAVGLGSVIRCVLTFKSSGNFTAPCVIWRAKSGSSFSKTISGKLTLTSACDFTGTIAIPSDPTVTVRYGHINGAVGSGIATQDTSTRLEVLQFTMIQK